jgi:N-acetyl-anhydromuramyl-L-alanine amidase AmpD
VHVEQFRSPNFESGRDDVEPIAVVVHTTDGTFGSAASWFARAESRVSAHYLVTLDGRVVQLVDETDTAFHAGRQHAPTSELLRGLDPNRATIGIEFVDDGDPAAARRPDAQYRAGAEVLRAISDRWGIPLDRTHVLGHRELNARKTCPGNVDLDRLLAEADNLATGRPDATLAP